ncbi:MAG TPA: NAD(P)/FAD-dependent oxidoreductase [Planctomycetota bacterium]|nr:NAD(P)/FAD-dependent oxidoreductase [Planctomycetota bacterium]
MHDDCDVLILGAGPAGSSLALRLARLGFKVWLADQHAFPRRKPCGEFLSPQCGPLLAELGVRDELLHLGMVHVDGMALDGFGQATHGRFRAPFARAETRGFAVRREVLDHALLRAACARTEVTFLARHQFRLLLRDAAGVVRGALLREPDGGLRPVRAGFVVGADGVHSRVAQALGVQRRLAWLDRFALVTHWRGVARAAHAEVHLFRGGYFAATGVDDGLFALNLVVDRRELQAHRGPAEALLAAKVAAVPAMAERLCSAVQVDRLRGTGPLAFTTTAQVAPGIALVGDACGYVDPITGEGIYFALFGARLLATALAAARADPRRQQQALATYSRQRAAEVLPRLRCARLLQHGLRRPAVTRAVLALLAARPGLFDLLVTLTGDTLHPRDLLRPSVWRQLLQAPG